MSALHPGNFSNYGQDFSTDSLIRQNIKTYAGVTIAQDVENSFPQALRDEAVSGFLPIMERLENYTKIQAEKKEKVEVHVGNRTIHDAVITQQ